MNVQSPSIGTSSGEKSVPFSATLNWKVQLVALPSNIAPPLLAWFSVKLQSVAVAYDDAPPSLALFLVKLQLVAVP